MSVRFGKWTLLLQYVRCGKRKCKTCPHGPYWYGYCSERGRTRSCYFGKKHPGASAGPPPAVEPAAAPHPFAAILNKATATRALALRILGFESPGVSDEAIKSRFRQLARECHPDRGGDEQAFVYINAAFSYLFGK